MRDFALDGRLASVMKFVRQGARFADVGTDHAYLPLALLRAGRIEHAVCSDINAGPLDSAKANAREAGLEDKMRFYLTDGAAALAGENLSDVAIAGMGGELIADIIDRAPFLRNENIRLILQPMSRQEHLRRFLWERGFEIEAEDYSYSQSKYYVTFCVHFRNASMSATDEECAFGKREFLDTGSSECLGYLKARLAALERAAAGKSVAGLDATHENTLINYLKGILENDG